MDAINNTSPGAAESETQNQPNLQQEKATQDHASSSSSDLASKNLELENHQTNSKGPSKFSPINSHGQVYHSHHFAPINRNGAQDEIVVGTQDRKTAAVSGTPQSAVEAGDVRVGETTEDEMPASTRPKRKRAPRFPRSHYLSDFTSDDDRTRPHKARKSGPHLKEAAAETPQPKSLESKEVPVGFYRKSTVPRQEDKHAVVAKVDKKDRLICRALSMSRDGKDLTLWPISPTSKSGSVNFLDVAFDDHLVGLTHREVKEYVRIRSAAGDKKETPEETHSANLASVELAKQCKAPAGDAGEPCQVAYGAVVPPDVEQPVRPEPKTKRPSKSNNNSTINSPLNSSEAGNGSASPIPIPQPTSAISPRARTKMDASKQDQDAQPAAQAADGKPIRILLGYWKKSSEPEEANKHAIIGVLGGNNQLRPRLVKQTRDGRELDGDFPQGAGRVWPQWHEVEYEQHLRPLTRSQLKEYCRIRQRQIDEGEQPQQKHANELEAVEEAQNRIPPGDEEPVGQLGPDPRLIERQQVGRPRARLSSVNLRDANRPKRVPTVEEMNARAQHHVANAEVLQRKNSQRAAAAQAAAVSAALSPAVPPPAPSPGPSAAPAAPVAAPPNNNRAVFAGNIGVAQRNWVAQTEEAARNGVDDAKVYLGHRYEYKNAGDFQGMYAGPGTVVTIGDEEYVENRVLRKVSRR